MKRWSYLISLTVLVLIIAVACGGDTTGEAGEPDAASQDQPAPTVEIAEEATLPPPVITEAEGNLEGQPPVSEDATEQEQPVEEETGQPEPVEEEGGGLPVVWIIVIVVVLGGAAAWFFLSRRS